MREYLQKCDAKFILISNVIRIIYIHLAKMQWAREMAKLHVKMNECSVLNWIYILHRFYSVHI